MVGNPEVTPNLDQFWKSACGKRFVDALVWDVGLALDWDSRGGFECGFAADMSN
jgi:hypothetical protein